MTRMKKLMAIVLVLVLVLQGTMLPSIARAGENVWQKLGDSGVAYATNVVIDPQDSKHIIITSGFNDLKQSWNGGTTFEDINPWNSDKAMITDDIYYVNGIWYFNSWGSIFKTQDWKKFDTVVDWNATEKGMWVDGRIIDYFWTNGELFYAGIRPGDSQNILFKSMDRGKTWTNLSAAVVQVGGLGVQKIIVFKSLLFVDSDPWLVSSDGGMTFKKVVQYTGATGNYVHLDVIGDSLWMTRQAENTIKESLDGINWKMVNKDAPINGFIGAYGRFLYDETRKIVYTAIGKKVLYSRDDGKTWVSYSEGLPTDNSDIFPHDGVLALNGGTLYLSLGKEFYSRSVPSEVQKTVIVLKIGSANFTVNGASQTLDSPPVIKNGRTLVPIRAIIEALGGTVGWDGTTRKATVTLGKKTIALWIGKNAATVNGVSTLIDSTNAKVVPEIINGRTMLPLRFVTENLGATVGWAAATKTITITYTP